MNYENCALLCDKSNNLFLVGLRVVSNNLTDTDYADLYKVDVDARTLTSVKNHKFSPSQGNAFNNNHFRWGACVEVLNENQIRILATERHYSDSATSEEYMNYDVW